MKLHALTNPYQHDPPDGQEIHDLQRALQAATFYRGSIDGVFGPATALACRQAKWEYGYPRRSVVETGGQLLYDFLTGKRKLPPLYRARRHARGYGLTKSQKIRARIVAYCAWGVEHSADIHYAEVRPMPVNAPYKLPMTTDCSGFATIAYKVAGAPDPNGLGYNGFGFTGSLLEHGEPVPLSQAEPGDLVIWGSYPGHHVAVIVDTADKADPAIVSHGNENDPARMPLSAENAAQNRPYIVRRYIGR